MIEERMFFSEVMSENDTVILLEMGPFKLEASCLTVTFNYSDMYGYYSDDYMTSSYNSSSSYTNMYNSSSSDYYYDDLHVEYKVIYPSSHESYFPKPCVRTTNDNMEICNFFVWDYQ